MRYVQLETQSVDQFDNIAGLFTFLVESLVWHKEGEFFYTLLAVTYSTERNSLPHLAGQKQRKEVYNILTISRNPSKDKKGS